METIIIHERQVSLISRPFILFPRVVTPGGELMRDLRTAKILNHEQNVQRYSRLLATELTELERQYLHKRIAEEHAELERWKHADASPSSTQRPTGQPISYAVD